ncbi:MAG TPA: FlgD immunoglobulin-like domain containing protein [Candidatus Eisenbacteria bacterium]|nr:FlgD immunoglobulin-like domain containing protein [Candidatus Eisenbacteria bacterium]
MFQHAEAFPGMDALRKWTLPILLLLAHTPAALAHEPDHTHASLTAAAFWYLGSPYTSTSARDRAVAGVVQEDNCPLYSSHFYNPRTEENTIANITINCPIASIGYVQQRAPDRAAALWNEAKGQYDSGDRLGAYETLGHILHLMQDMTSPSHCHNNPHGKLNDADCDQDDDDFENWGFCDSRGTRHIRDYWNQTTALPTDALRHNLEVLFPEGAQKACREPDELACHKAGEPNIAFTYVRRVAQIVYDFTTFQAVLTEVDTQPDSELKRMFPSLADAVGGWAIEGADENIGFTKGGCGRTEGTLDIQEEWWPMENADGEPLDFEDNGGDDGPDCTITGNNANQRIVAGVFLENIGGGGSGAGNSAVNAVVPKRWERKAAGRELYHELYGTRDNPDKRTMLRIYGDILYPIAIVYGAGLVNAFLEEIVGVPVADAGGPYEGECGVPITLDGSGSHDANGTIVSYEWDFEGDGVYDSTTTTPTVTHVFHSTTQGVIRLRVTDNDNPPLQAVDEATVTLRDTVPPTIHAIHASPATLWPPNHKMVGVAFTVDAADLCDESLTSRIVGISCTDSLDLGGGRHTTPDFSIRDDLTAELRSERAGGGDGRSYDVLISCKDDAGNETQAMATVRCEHDRGKGSVTVERVRILATPVAATGSSTGSQSTDSGSDNTGRSGAGATATALFGASPNPSRGEGWIGFQLRNPATATIDVFDARGRLVRRLATGDYPMGQHSVRWDGRSQDGAALGQGVYWLRLEAEGLRFVKRIVMIR